MRSTTRGVDTASHWGFYEMCVPLNKSNDSSARDKAVGILRQTADKPTEKFRTELYKLCRLIRRNRAKSYGCSFSSERVRLCNGARKLGIRNLPLSGGLSRKKIYAVDAKILGQLSFGGGAAMTIETFGYCCFAKAGAAGQFV